MLNIENVSYSYKNSDRDVLKNVSANFEGGKLQAIVGPSGSGKTTLLSIMAGLDRPKSGTVTIDGDDLATMDLDQYRRERIAIIFQAFQLFPLLTAIENVCYPMEQNGVDRKTAQVRAKELLESVGIDESKHNRYPANLSGGEQQRVAIARSLSSGARVILADEPTGNLDKENGDAVIGILQSLAHDNGYCVIVVTHNMEIAEISDVIFRMSDGQIVESKSNQVQPAPSSHPSIQDTLTQKQVMQVQTAESSPPQNTRKKQISVICVLAILLVLSVIFVLSLQSSESAYVPNIAETLTTAESAGPATLSSGPSLDYLTEIPTIEATNAVALAYATVGDLVGFGEYNWLVLDVQDYSALLVSEIILEFRPFHETRESVTWEYSTIRNYLNNEFLYKFSPDDRARIAESRLTNNDNPWYYTPGGNDTYDRIFLLSLEEVVRYFGDSGRLGSSPTEWGTLLDWYGQERIAHDRYGNISWWWLRSPGGAENSVAGVLGDANGSIAVVGAEVNSPGIGMAFGAGVGVRPALRLYL